MMTGVSSYTAEAMTEYGLVSTCATNDTYCPLYNMACGQIYNVSVTAHNDVCPGVAMSTEPVSIMTGVESLASLGFASFSLPFINE